MWHHQMSCFVWPTLHTSKFSNIVRPRKVVHSHSCQLIFFRLIHWRIVVASERAALTHWHTPGFSQTTRSKQQRSWFRNMRLRSSKNLLVLHKKNWTVINMPRPSKIISPWEESLLYWTTKTQFTRNRRVMLHSDFTFQSQSLAEYSQWLWESTLTNSLKIECSCYVININ